MTRSTARSLTLTLALFALALGNLNCAGKNHPRKETQAEERPAQPVEHPVDSQTDSPPDKSEGPGQGPSPLSAIPITQVGFERNAPGHSGMSVTGLRYKDAQGQVLIEQHYALGETSAVAGRSVARVTGVKWTPAENEAAASLNLTCENCCAIDLNNDRRLVNVVFTSSKSEPFTGKTSVTLSDKSNLAQSLTLSFRDAEEASLWADVTRACGGVAEAQVRIPRGSSTAALEFRLGPACGTEWNWYDAPAE